MRRSKRWFRCSQTINTDPEIRQLKKDCGLSGFSMWLEILARTDGTPDGLWKGSERGIGGVLAGVCDSNTRGSARVLQYLTDLGWIRWQRGSRHPHRGVTEGVNNGSVYPHRGETEAIQRGSEVGNRWDLIVANHSIWQGLEIQDEKIKKTQSSPNPPFLSYPSEEALKSPPVDNSKIKETVKNRIVQAVASMSNGNAEKSKSIMVWVNLKRNQIDDAFPGIEWVAQAIDRLKVREGNGIQIQSYGRYLDTLYEKVRTEWLQAESQRHKAEPIPPVFKPLIEGIGKKI